jgi:hypothetical protein
MTDFDSLGEIDVVIEDVYGLRTFKVVDGKLSSVVVGTGYWENGICDAVCVNNRNPDHVAPDPDCRCGIYATSGIDHLLRQYGEEAAKIVAVVQAVGTTIRGDTGFKTRQAHVVAYWVADDVPAEEQACAEHCPGARRWWDRDLMIEIFELEGRS